MHRSNCEVAVALELRYVDSTNAVCLDCIDIDNIAILWSVRYDTFALLRTAHSHRCSSRRLRLMMGPCRSAGNRLSLMGGTM